MARELEEKLSKNEILELYLNRVYFGSGFYGLGAASRFYFDKDPQDLTLAEASLLATLPKAPSRLALDDNMEGAKQRQAYVLSEMLQAGFVTPESVQIALAADVKIAPEPEQDPQFGFILDAATERANELMPELPDDMVIRLTIDAELQTAVSEALEARMDRRGGRGESRTNRCRADEPPRASRRPLWWPRLYRKPVQSRHPGPPSARARRSSPSSMQPPWISGVSPYDVRIDQPVTIDDWSPKNFTRAHMGPVTVNEAMRDSLNTIAAMLAQETSEETIISLARKFGISAEMQPFPSIALGSQEVTLWELTRAYGPFMTGGRRVDPYLIEAIETTRGDVIYQRAEYEPASVYDRENAELMTAMMADVIRSGTGTAAQVDGWPIAGKTGTSQSSRDAWFVGYSAELLGGIWTGNDDDTPMDGVTGGGLPAKLWADMMRIAHEGRSPSLLRGADQAHPAQSRATSAGRLLPRSRHGLCDHLPGPGQ